jgi:hypothetical protein
VRFIIYSMTEKLVESTPKLHKVKFFCFESCWQARGYEFLKIAPRFPKSLILV